MKSSITCSYCGASFLKENGQITRALAAGPNIYCSQECTGLGRRAWRSIEERKEAKRIYDNAYRDANKKMLKTKKAERHKRTYDPEKARVDRKKRMPRHIEYCRQPEYREWKKNYDAQFRAKEYGEYADVFKTLLILEREIASRMSDYDIRCANGTINKRLQRKREHEKLVCRQS